MNCRYYQDKFDKYVEGRLTDNFRKEIDDHIENCAECREQLAITELSELVFSEEKKIKSNPFLSSKIMEQLEGKQRVSSESEILSLRVLRPVLVAASIIVAVILGISVGNMSSSFYLSKQVPDELIFINDAEIESLSLFITE